MKHELSIEPSVSRTFSLPLQAFGSKLVTFSLPHADKWHALPARFLDGIDFASRLLGSKVYVADGKALTTNNKVAIEYDMAVECPVDLSLTVKEVRAIKAFGSSPSRASVLDKQQFKWANGSSLALSSSSRRDDAIIKLLDSHDWRDLHAVNEQWRAQIIGHFSFKAIRGESDLLTLFPDRIVGGIFYGRPHTELRIETHTERQVVFEKAVLLKALKVATEIKFIHDGDHCRLLFRGENLRGVAASQQRVSP